MGERSKHSVLTSTPSSEEVMQAQAQVERLIREGTFFSILLRAMNGGRGRKDVRKHFVW